MILQQTILTLLLLLSPSFLCVGMDKSITPPTYTLEDAEWLFPKNKFIDFQGKQYNKIQDNFRQKWGYDIPEIVVKETIGEKIVYKTVAKNYIAKNKHLKLEVVDIFNILTPKKTIPVPDKKIKQNTDEIKELQARAKLLEKTVAEKRAQNKKLEEEIALFNNMTLEQKCTYFNNLISQPQKSIPQTIHAFSQKKVLPQHNPNTNEPQQKFLVLRSLFSTYKVKNIKQLKNKIAQECDESNLWGKCGRVNHYCSWAYDNENRELIIYTDDCESSDSYSNDSSSDSFYDDSSSD